jgi:O-antigen/teichoic acid export membrane protein
VKSDVSERRQVAGEVRKGLAWSTINTLVLRAGQVVLSVILARLLTPAQFGVYAVALAVQGVITILADLGMNADLIRSEDHEAKGPTVLTLSVVTGGLLTGLMVGTARPLASAMGSPASAAPIAVLSVTIILSSIGVVPLAQLQREFRQHHMAVVMGADFLVSTILTVVLVLFGWGAMALAIGRVVAQCTSTSLQFWFTKRTPKFGFHRGLIGPVLRYGVPLAGANILGWALLSIDKVVIARAAGPTVLGLYVMAFNVASLPSSVIAQAVRGVSLPAFARVRPGRESDVMESVLFLIWTIGVLASVLIAALSVPLVGFLFGEKWAAAAPALAVLALAGGFRLLIEQLTTFMLARGDSRSVLIVQALWFGALMLALVPGTRWAGSVGAAWAQVAVAGMVILPLTIAAAGRSGVNWRPVLRSLWLPALLAIPAFLVAHWSSRVTGVHVLALLVGGTAGVLIFAVPVLRWFLRHLSLLRAPTPAPAE